MHILEKLRWVVALALGAVLSSQAAYAGIIQLDFSGAVISQGEASNGESPSEFIGSLQFDTSVAGFDAIDAESYARFESVFATDLPGHVPFPPNRIALQSQPELVQSLSVSLSGGSLLGAVSPDATSRAFAIEWLDGIDEDRILIEIAVSGLNVTEQLVFRLELFGDGDSIWPSAGSPVDTLSALQALASADLSGLAGNGSVAVSRASPFNAFSLAIDSVDISAVSVPEPIALSMLLLGLGVFRIRHVGTTNLQALALRILALRILALRTMVLCRKT